MKINGTTSEMKPETRDILDRDRLAKALTTFVPQTPPHRCPNCGACPYCGYPMPIAHPWSQYWPWPGTTYPYVGGNTSAPWVGSTVCMTAKTQVHQNT